MFFRVTVPLSSPISREQVFPFLHIIANTYYLLKTLVSYLVFVLSDCDFDFGTPGITLVMLSTILYICWPFVYILRRDVYSVHFYVYLFACFCYCVVRVPCIFWKFTLYIYHLHIVSPITSVAVQSVDCLFFLCFLI